MLNSSADKASYLLPQAMIRGRTYYTNFRLNDSTRFICASSEIERAGYCLAGLLLADF